MAGEGGDEGSRRRIHGWVSGRVQGVFFRASTRARAQALGLAGWVRNLADGRVEVVAEGEAAAVAQLLAWLHVGPDHAVVTDLTVRDEPLEGLHVPFQVRG